MDYAHTTEGLLERLGELLTRLERLLPGARHATDWTGANAFRWRRESQGGRLQAILAPHRIKLEELLGIDSQKHELERNTRQFIAGLPANNALLWGSRGTGKSSLVKALLHGYAEDGLRLLEVDAQELVDLPDIVEQLYDRPERFVLFCDDLSFEADDASYKALKAVLDGSLTALPDNVVVYATSNRRHLMPEFMEENRVAQHVRGEIHHADAVEEKISLSERFGLWLSFYPFDQATYLHIVDGWLQRLGLGSAERRRDHVREAALRWSLGRGSRSGRAAYQFARDWVGRNSLH